MERLFIKSLIHAYEYLPPAFADCFFFFSRRRRQPPLMAIPLPLMPGFS